jgi:hypothetical protein
MHGSIVKAAVILGISFVIGGVILSGTLWFAVHTAIARVDQTIAQMTEELATPIQSMFDQPVQVVTARPIQIGHPVELKALELEETIAVRMTTAVPVTFADAVGVALAEGITLTIEDPITVRGTWEDGVLGISTEIPGRGP